ncbi:M56 family metallopeptidase [Sediminibacterium ginsengisoli]|uniref:Signal transducer regulating beta-lactamase production, contains metallopeptidase domain n=1 Tax=Sediminibacterium ginsengisoli TaxID=413434 RepID=A0A1T4PN27_9BACT|nr:M56 family metallopeptidase [Sediminibacterium ginsengisoli]SJZ92963.1 Signal transducer regulating beta-lactamase production, contains metallopeptidase domain [Sediminibacterium ginsengisoli]
MPSLFQSSFLQALGCAIANSLWQMALLWLVYIAVSFIARFQAANKYKLAVCVQLTGFAWFLVTLRFYHIAYKEVLLESGSLQERISPVVYSNTGFRSQLIAWMVKAEQLLPYLSVAYLFLILFLFIRWMVAYRQLRSIRTDGTQKIPVNWRLFVRRVAEQLGIKKEVQILLSDKVHTPLTIGFFKPLILVPLASINHLSTEQMEAVILHELAHIKRYDYIVNIFLSVVEISLFFNPFTQLISKSIKKERENSCDDWVLQFQYSAPVYAEALLRIASLQKAPAFAMTAARNEHELLGRVKRMIGHKEQSFNYRKQLLSLFLVTGILSSIAWLSPDNRNRQAPTTAVAVREDNEQRQAVAVEPMAVQVNNPLFNPVFFLNEPLRKEIKENLAQAAREIHSSADSIAMIQPLVAGALSIASRELEKANWEKELKRINQATDIGSIKIDTEELIAPMIQVPLKLGIAKSIEGIEAGLKNVKMDIAAKAGKEAALAGIEDENLKQGLRAAFEQIEKLELDKIVGDALRGVPDKIDLPALIKASKQKAADKKNNTTPAVQQIPLSEIEQEKKTTPVLKEVTPADKKKYQLPADKNTSAILIDFKENMASLINATIEAKTTTQLNLQISQVNINF